MEKRPEHRICKYSKWVATFPGRGRGSNDAGDSVRGHKQDAILCGFLHIYRSTFPMKFDELQRITHKKILLQQEVKQCGYVG